MTQPTLVAGFTRQDLAASFGQLGFRRGAEIGVRQGAFSLSLCLAMPGLELFCVDPWTHYPTNPKQPSQDRQDENFRVAQERLAPFCVTFVRQPSRTAVQTIPMGALDFCYIDGNHAYAYVRQDLEDWSRRVRPGGIVSGDDYDAPDVELALREFTAQAGITEWWLTDDPTRRNRKGDRFTSWWWVKS